MLMKQTAIIYCRKSTDREWRQENTHITQLEKCKQVCDLYGFAIIDEIVESVSAKNSWTRKWFKQLLDYCNSWKVDYVIIDEPDRLSRDDMDTAEFITMLRKGKIQGIYVNGREIRYDDDYAINMLWNQLWLSKLDNSIRSKKVKKNMQTALNRGLWLSRAIFGYKNVWDKKKRWIEVVEDEEKLVVEAFRMRVNQKTFQEIGYFLNDKTGTKWNSSKISNMIKNKKYYWVQEFWGWEAKIDTKWYRPLISESLYEKANNIGVSNSYKKRDDFPKYLKWILKDTDKQNYYPLEKKKKYIYYHNSWRKSNYYVCINEDKIFEEFEKHIKDYNFPQIFQDLSRETLKDHFIEKTKEIENDKRKNTKEINTLEERLKNLKIKWLDKKIWDDEYSEDKASIENELENEKEKKNAINDWEKNIIENIEEFLELSKDLAGSYKNWNKRKKAKIIRLVCLELILDNKKELTIKENKLFENIKMCNINDWYSYGELNPSSSLEKAMS